MVDGAGGGHSASVLCHYREVSGAVVLRQVKLWLVVTHVMRGVICDLFTEVIGIDARSHIVDELWKRKWDMKKRIC